MPGVILSPVDTDEDIPVFTALFVPQTDHCEYSISWIVLPVEHPGARFTNCCPPRRPTDDEQPLPGLNATKSVSVVRAMKRKPSVCLPMRNGIGHARLIGQRRVNREEDPAVGPSKLRSRDEHCYATPLAISLRSISDVRAISSAVPRTISPSKMANPSISTY